jgi:hypothetical protein
MTKEEMQAKMDSAVSKMETHYNKLKADMDAAGDSVSDETREAMAKAESLLDKGKAKASELANATDEEFEAMKDSVEENWDAIAGKFEAGWDDLSAKVKNFFS